MKPRVFVGSSSEKLDIAFQLQSNLEDVGEFTVWNQSVFRPSEYPLESLLKALRTADVGVFVFSADDILTMRGAEHAAVRDNVIFEFGLFVGHLGREKSIIVAPKGEDQRLPTDLLGLTVLKYDPNREDGNINAALGPACISIRRALLNIEPQRSSIPLEFVLNFIERRDQLSPTQRELLSAISTRDSCTKRDLSRQFPDLRDAELHYRLEQLRLLMFVTALTTVSPDATDTVYTVSDAYRSALAKPHFILQAPKSGSSLPF
jgi:Predicted nucleotide-binding protein containing TIR-like domain